MKIKTIILVIVCLGLALIIHFPDSFWKIGPFAMIIAFGLCLIIGWISLIRNHGWRKATSTDLVTQVNNASSATLNKVEKDILISSISIIVSVLISILFVPIISQL